MVKAGATSSAASLFALVEKSELLGDRLAEVRTLADSSGDARSLAKELVTRSLVTKWQANQLLNGYYHFSLGKYRLLDQIGVGRIGREFLAEHVQLGKRVAIKLVSRNLTADANRLKHFLAESRRAVSLDHPHLVHSSDVDQDKHRYYVVTEFVDGENLQKRVERNGPCTVGEALEFLRQAAEGLQHAVVGGVLHGDLKPSNLLIDKQGSLKVADLGFARLVDGAPKAPPQQDSKEQNLQDGIEYCAPEALNAIEGDLDCRADMFSLGQTLYFLLTGKVPSPPAASMEDRKASLRDANVAPQIAAFFARLTALHAAERPGNWKEVLEQIRSLESKASAAPPPKRKSPVAKALAEAESAPVVFDAAETVSQEAVHTEETQPIIIAADNGRLGRGRSAAPTANRPVAEVASEPAAAQPVKPAKSKKPDPKLVLGIAIGGGVLLLLLSVGILWMVLGRGTKQVAAGPQDKGTDAAASRADSKAATALDVEEETNPEVNPEPPVTPAVAPKPEEKQPEATKPKETEPSPPATDVAGVKPVAATPNPEPAPMPEPAPLPMPEPAPAPMPEPPKDPAPPPPAGKPFEKLPTMLTLPDVSKPGEMFTLGELALPKDKGLRILMHGGEGAARSKATFTLHNANSETDENNWEVVLQKVVIAKLHREPDKLTFEWTPEAASQPAAPSLTNCLLQLSAASDEHYLQLRTPVEYDPEAINLEKGTKWSATIDNLPSATTVELVGLDPAAFPNPDFKTETKSKTCKIEGQVMWYGDGQDARNLGLLIDKRESGRRVDVNIAPVFRADNIAAQKLTKRLLPDLARGLEQQLNILTVASAANDKSEGSAEQKEQRRNLINVDLQRGREQLERVTKAVQLLTNAHDKAVLHVRVSYDTGAGKVVLAQTKGAPPPEPLGRKAEPKPEAAATPAP